MIIELQHDFPKKITDQLFDIFPCADIRYLSTDSEYTHYFSVKRERDDSLNDILNNTKIINQDITNNNLLFKIKKKFICNYLMSVISNNISSVQVTFTDDSKNLILDYYIGLNGWTLIASESKYWNMRYVVSIDEIQKDNNIINHTNKDIIYYMLYTKEIINILEIQGYNIDTVNLLEMFNENPEQFRELLYLNEMLIV